eukprot:1142655-Pelagomonas_calceolata.AAC.1
MSPIRGGGGQWVVGGGSTFLGPPLQNFSGSLLQDFKYIIGFLSSRTVDWHPLSANWVKGGVWVHGWESVPCAQGCWQQGVWRRMCCKPIQTSRIMTMYDVLLHCEFRRAVCGLAGPVVSAWKGRYASTSAAQFLPQNSAATQLFSVVNADRWGI